MRSEAENRAFEDRLLGAPPDPLMPSQFFESVGSRAFSSEQRLMLAVLMDAINILREYRFSPNQSKRKSFNEVSSWVFAKGIEGPVSFDGVCDALGVNAERLRERLSESVSQGGGVLLRLRLKAGGRIQRITGRRVRRRKRLVS
jgi:hypothetical protein